MKLHLLKIKDEYYKEVLKGSKSFEIRKNDRDFKTGDHIRFTDLDRNPRPGEWRITYVLKDCPEYGLKEGYAILSIVRVDKEEP